MVSFVSCVVPTAAGYDVYGWHITILSNDTEKACEKVHSYLIPLSLSSLPKFVCSSIKDYIILLIFIKVYINSPH